MGKYIAMKGLQPGESALPEDEAVAAPSLPPLNEGAFAQLQEMGFSAIRAEKALRITGNSDADTAMQWLFEHMDDPDVDQPWQPPAAGSQAPVDTEKVSDLVSMGFAQNTVKRALRETVISSVQSRLIAGW
jgi:ubiquitin carboxyl-terminal hydrolase 5/13